ncbi:MAG: peroxiredoxin [Chloroflexi bacterium]|nr:peroxiredoxin [Chloroflexota bacterium]MBV9135028.1 peroxiredoxin [Chloroflexota bacterium]MBV9896790.1 peroxiredoxin [Chloroflexota bacterium]
MAQLKVGDPAPDFDMLSDQGARVKLSEQRGKRVVLYFYPKDDTPGCTRQACGLRDNYARIESGNAVVFGVSPDDQASHQAFKEKFNLPFPLLVDEGHKVAEAYSVWGEQQRNVRSHFVIDENGKLADVQVQVTPEESVERALASVAG